jgi:CrcB protein
MLKTLLFIACGGAIGSLFRYGSSLGIYALVGKDFPYGTLFVNVLGSFLMGLLSILMVERLNIGPEWRAMVLVGLLGSFTTFSTFSIETLNLFEQGDMFKALANIVFSIIVCISAVWLGVIAGRQI